MNSPVISVEEQGSRRYSRLQNTLYDGITVLNEEEGGRVNDPLLVAGINSITSSLQEQRRIEDAYESGLSGNSNGSPDATGAIVSVKTPQGWKQEVSTTHQQEVGGMEGSLESASRGETAQGGLQFKDPSRDIGNDLCVRWCQVGSRHGTKIW